MPSGGKRRVFIYKLSKKLHARNTKSSSQKRTLARTQHCLRRSVIFVSVRSVTPLTARSTLSFTLAISARAHPWYASTPECLTGDAFHSLRCDCGQQLHASMKAIQEAGHGAIVYMRQEGRGIGLYSKMQAYALQDEGYDTLDANLALGLPGDARRYDFAAEMLYTMGVQSVQLVTNNPDKRDQLTQFGIDVMDRIPIIVGACAQNQDYLHTKAARMGHLLPV